MTAPVKFAQAGCHRPLSTRQARERTTRRFSYRLNIEALTRARLVHRLPRLGAHLLHSSLSDITEDVQSLGRSPLDSAHEVVNMALHRKRVWGKRLASIYPRFFRRRLRFPVLEWLLRESPPGSHSEGSPLCCTTLGAMASLHPQFLGGKSRRASSLEPLELPVSCDPLLLSRPPGWKDTSHPRALQAYGRRDRRHSRRRRLPPMCRAISPRISRGKVLAFHQRLRHVLYPSWPETREDGACRARN